MSRYLKAPKCHWPQCGRTMFLLNENDGFWYFQCECGCARALTKPSARAQSLYVGYKNSVEQERKRQQYLSSRPSFSAGGI
jgi:hypothetical protein